MHSHCNAKLRQFCAIKDSCNETCFDVEKLVTLKQFEIGRALKRKKIECQQSLALQTNLSHNALHQNRVLQKPKVAEPQFLFVNTPQ